MSQLNQPKTHNATATGFTLVELLLTVALLGMVMLSITNMLIKGNALSNSMDTRYQEATEIQAVIQDMMHDLSQGAYISSNSSNKRLEYTTYNTANAAVKKVYGICYAPANVASTDTTCSVNSGANNTAYLKYSIDGGSTWGTPYRISAFNKYQLTGTPLFLYAHDANNCTNFVDTDANGVWLSGTDAAGAFLDCGNNDTSSPLLTSPNQATKVVLSGFNFTSSSGSPTVPRTLPSNVFMHSPQGLVISTLAAVSPGVKDSALLKSFDTSTANSLFGANFYAYGLQWDPSRQRLLVAGTYSTGGAMLYQVDRMGVIIGPGLSLGSATTPVAVSLLGDGTTVMVLDFPSYIRWYSLTGSSPLTPFRTMYLPNPSDTTKNSPALTGSTSLVSVPYGMVYDPKYPDEVFIVGQDPADNGWKIFEISTLTGSIATNAIATGKITLPAAIDSTHVPFGLTLDPTSGDFYVTRDYINGSAPNRTIDIYRIPASGAVPSTPAFSVSVDDLGTVTATGENGYFGLSYNPESNHFFFSNPVVDGKIYEVYPSVLISPRS